MSRSVSRGKPVGTSERRTSNSCRPFGLPWMPQDHHPRHELPRQLAGQVLEVVLGQHVPALGRAGVHADEHLVGVGLVEMHLLRHVAQLVHGQGPAGIQMLGFQPQERSGDGQPVTQITRFPAAHLEVNGGPALLVGGPHPQGRATGQGGQFQPGLRGQTHEQSHVVLGLAQLAQEVAEGRPPGGSTGDPGRRCTACPCGRAPPGPRVFPG